MNSAIRVVAISLFISVAVGFVLAAAIIYWSLMSPSGTQNDLTDLLLASLMVSLPITVPLGFIGGAIAVWGSRRSATSANPAWVRRGAIWGLTVGSLGGGAAAVVFSTVSVVWAIYLCLGGLGGAISGSLVGLWLRHGAARKA